MQSDSKATTRKKGRTVSNWWLQEYRCNSCAGDAVVENGHIRINHHVKCALRKRLYKRFPGLMEILEREWVANV